MSKNVLVIDEMHHSLDAMLESIGYQSVYRPQILREEIIAEQEQYIGMIVRGKTKIDGDLLRNQTALKFVGRAGAGIDNLDVNYLNSRNIQIINAPEGNRDALGEHVVGMLLSLSNKLIPSDREVRSYVWDREGNRGFELKGKTVGILGYGFMGSAVAEKLSGFGCEVIAYDNEKTNFSNHNVREVTMDEIFAKADVFSMHVPLKSDTRSLVDLDYLNRFKKNIVFVNSARGESVVTSDLLQALKSGKVTHAALDVLENEKFKTLSTLQRDVYDELFAMPNVIFSPHIGGWTFESYENINRVLIHKISKLGI